MITAWWARRFSVTSEGALAGPAENLLTSLPAATRADDGIA